MSNLYLHYPFCKQACHYCNFHFSTASKNRDRIWDAMQYELRIRAEELEHPIESIYFGGGSPSLLNPEAIRNTIRTIESIYKLKPEVEITLETNPDDVTAAHLDQYIEAGVNRLSLGVQSFLDRDLKGLNRAHSSTEALRAVELIATKFANFSLDLIYGLPDSNLIKWEENLSAALSFKPPHLSCYALTVEPKTKLAYQVKNNEVIPVPEEQVEEQYRFLVHKMEELGYVNYEFSNFGKPHFYSVNNQNYWKGKPYLGIGPSAHSYDGKCTRKWNVSSNLLYLKAIEKGELPLEQEHLSTKDLYNEYIMTGLRTLEGVSLLHIKKTFGNRYALYLEAQVQRHLENRYFFWDGDFIKISKKGKFLTDGLAADLFIV
jgi:oxygen-independent coproporphyrinogen-3 oxidase